MLEEKRQALTRRANKLIEWLHRPQYAVYVDPESTAQLIKLINLIIWALERSIPANDWEHFKQLLIDGRYLATDKFEDKYQEINAYATTLHMIEDTLKEYTEFINSHDISVVYSE